MNDPRQLPHSPSPEFRSGLKREISRELRRDRGPTLRRGFHFGNFATVLATAAGTLVALAIGLVLGTNTGYASARVQANQQHDDLAGTVQSVATQFAALRTDLARTRLELARRATATDAVSQASLLAAENDLRSMETTAARIEFELVQGRNEVALPQSPLLGTVPMKRALTLTCNALSLNTATGRDNGATVPVVDVPEATARAAEPFGNVLSVHQTSNGSILVNDGTRRQIIRFDSTLAGGTVVLDSSSDATHSYGPYATALFSYRGDSSVFVPATNARTAMVLDAQGMIARTTQLQFDSTTTLPLVGVKGTNGFDMKGRLVYRNTKSVSNRSSMQGNGKFVLHQPGDTVEILRMEFDNNRIDTVGRIVQPSNERLGQLAGPDDRANINRIINPLVTTDDWTLIPSGTVAIVRGADYHVDWVHTDGTTSATKLPFDWKRLSDSDKQRLVDSARTSQVMMATRAALAAVNFAASGAQTDNGVAGRGGRSDGGGRADMQGRAGSGPGARVGGGGARGAGAGGRGRGGGPPPWPYEFAPLSEMADYYPPIRRGSVMADPDGNVWILPTSSRESRHGELVYDVVNEKEGLLKRVRLPVGRSVVGFGAGNVVFLLAGDRTNGFTLERTHVPYISAGVVR